MAFNINPGKQQFSATAAQTVFTFNFAIFAGTDIKVYKTLAGAVSNDTTDLLTIATHYTVSINGTLGGTVTLLSGASLNDTITIVRVLPITRTTDYVTNGDLYADTLDLDQDYQTYLTLDQKQKWERSVVMPDTYSGSQIDFPVPSQYKFIRWNLAEDGFENVDPSTVLSSSDAAIINNVTDFLSIDTSVYTTAIVKDLDIGGTFIWSSTGTANDGTVFAGATGYWNRQYSGAVNIKWFGANSIRLDNEIPIQNALSFGSIYIPNGIYTVSNEIIVGDNNTIIGENERAAILIWNSASNGSNKALIRCSKSVVGTNPTLAVSGAVVSNLSINATLCDFGIYTFYFTNESILENLTVSGANISNISILKSWFSTYRKLSANSGLNIGMNIGVPMAGETGDIAVNSVELSDLSAHSNGLNSNWDITTNKMKCAGFLFNITSSFINQIQSEQNRGCGIYLIQSYNVDFGSIYLEANCYGSAFENRALWAANSYNSNSSSINQLFLGVTEKVYLDVSMLIKNVTRLGNINTFSGAGIATVLSHNLGVFSNTVGDSFNIGVSKKWISSTKGEFVDDVVLNSNGLKFKNVAQSNATILDWYEEGTFLPTIIGTTTAGVGTYTSQQGKFTRVGNRCNVDIVVSISNHTGTGNIDIGGLPFALIYNDVPVSMSIGYCEGLTYTKNQLLALADYNYNGGIRLWQKNPNESPIAVPIDTSFVIMISGSYKV